MSISNVDAPPSPTHRRDNRASRTDSLLARLDATSAPDERKCLIDDLVVANMGVARSVAQRYRGRGIAEEDLEQVAYLALVRVVRRYDHSTGHDFLSYAVPSIRGEIRRHFRDRGWMVRPTRRIQELQAQLASMESGLATELGRPPTAADLADALQTPLALVEEAIAANGCFTPSSLDRPTGEGSGAPIGHLIGEEDPGPAAAEARLMLSPVVRRLSGRDRRILMLRYVDDCSQQEIAEEIGITQSQISRLLGRILDRLRDDLTAGQLTPSHR